MQSQKVMSPSRGVEYASAVQRAAAALMARRRNTQEVAQTTPAGSSDNSGEDMRPELALVMEQQDAMEQRLGQARLRKDLWLTTSTTSLGLSPEYATLASGRKEESCEKSSNSSTFNNMRPCAKDCGSPQKPKTCSCEQWQKHKRHSKRSSELLSKLHTDNYSRSNDTC
uniref:Uncharacterized protein n=1 Tax=Peronospora matthiolae TaxID=2874970 RepID=A0AAV1TRY6_9STRA